MLGLSKFILTLALAIIVCPGTVYGQILGQSNLEKVKQSVLLLDQTRTLVQALDLSDCFIETKWSSFTDKKGRDIVQFQGRFKDISAVAHRIRPTLGRMNPDNDYATFQCGQCIYYIQFAMLKSQTSIPALGIQGTSFTILGSWFDAEVVRTAGGVTYSPESIRAPEQGNNMEVFSAELLGLGGTGLALLTLQQIYAGGLPDVVATVFTSISAALNKPYNRDYFSALSEDQVVQIARENEQKAQQRLREGEKKDAARIAQENKIKEDSLKEYRQYVLSEFFEAWKQVNKSSSYPDGALELHDSVGIGISRGRDVYADETVAPLQQTAPDWRNAVLLVRAGPRGKISKFFMTSVSGHKVVDGLVLQTAGKVQVLNAPPPEFLVDDCYEFSIKFTLPGPGIPAERQVNDHHYKSQAPLEIRPAIPTGYKPHNPAYLGR